MKITEFLKLVEIQTKVASVIPFLFGTLYTLYTFDTFDLTNAILMFLSMLLFDMTTTAINNYIDHTTAIKKEGYGYEQHNAIGLYKMNVKGVRFFIYAMLMVSSGLGFLLFLNTNVTVLLLGMLCFGVGIIYTFGPLPISRTPFGELFSGLAMGLLLTFISIYIHIYDQEILSFSWASMSLSVTFNLKVLIGIVVVSIPLINCIANIMLANNLCDMEEDLLNKRYTLPIYIGKDMGLHVWRSLYYISYISIIIAICLRYLPLFCLLTLITFIPVNKNIASFNAKQLKSETFVNAIKNFLLINGCYLFSLLLALLLI